MLDENLDTESNHSVLLAWMLATVGSLGFFTNIVQLVLNCRDEFQKSSVFSLALLSLNIADLLAAIAIFLRGVTIVLIIFTIIDDGTVFTRATEIAIIFSLTSSFTHVAFMATQRVIAVALPLKVKQIITKSRCCVVLLLIWLVSVASAVAVYFNVDTGSKTLACIGIAVGLALISMYSFIGYKTVRRDQQNVVNNASEEMQRRRRRSERDVLIYSVAIASIFIICNFPNGISSFVEYSKYLQIVSETLYSINPFFDSLLYFVVNYCRRKRERERRHPAPLELGNNRVGHCATVSNREATSHL